MAHNNVMAYHILEHSGADLSCKRAYGFVTASRFEKQKKQEIKKDIAEFGQCCGLESGACTFEPKLRKLDQIDIAAPKKDI